MFIIYIFFSEQKTKDLFDLKIENVKMNDDA